MPINRTAVTRQGFPLGLDTRSAETDLDPKALRAAVNVDIDREGNVLRRAGFASAGGGAGHSLWTWPGLNYALYVSAAGQLTRLDADGSVTALSAVAASRRMSYCYFNGRAYYANGAALGYVDSAGALKPWGIDRPPAPKGTITTGNLEAGRYQVAYRVIYNGGEESAPSLVTMFEATSDNAGIALSPLPTSASITHLNIYVSSTKAANGSELYHHATVPAGTSAYTILSASSGYRLDTLNLDRMPAGTLIAPFKRRLLAASGTNLWFSEATQASLCDRRHNWLPFDERITAILPVEDGVYIGTPTRLWWCMGTDPADWERTVIQPTGVIPHYSNIYVPEDVVLPEFPVRGPAVPFWSTEAELCMARSGGIIQRLSGKRLAVAPHARVTMTYRERNGIRQILSTLSGQSADNRRAAPNTPVSTINNYGITLS